MPTRPPDVPEEAALEELLSRPTAAVVESLRALPGDLLLLGAGGKMGPSLARLARRASEAAGTGRRVIAAARFAVTGLRAQLECDGIETMQCDLFDREAVARLPEAPNLVYLVGQKFGTAGQEERTWAINAFLPGMVAERFPRARIVAFSTGNVYPLSAVSGPGPSEADPTGPVGEYAQSALARERVLTFFSRRNQTAMALLRLNYAIEPRYGVLRDIADRVWEGEPVDLAMGRVNVIWQRDANAVALLALAHCAVPPLVLNVTGRPAVAVRWIAEQFAARWAKSPVFTGSEGETALLSNAGRMEALFGAPEVGIAEMIEAVAGWVEQGGRSLGKRTHFGEREGKF
jgi:nucleoside-diphosphate-sugar epimerase